MTYEFKCDKCEIVTEVVSSLAKANFEDRPCEYCDGTARHMYSLSAVSTQGMGTQTTDVAVGIKAAEKWSEVIRRQGIRDKVRRETRQIGLTEVQRDDFRPVPTDTMATRALLR